MKQMDLTADQIRKMTRPEQLYTGDREQATKEYKVLRSKWHPDHSGDGVVFHTVTSLYDQAMLKLELGTWEPDGMIQVSTRTGNKYELKYQSRRAFELGEVYSAPTKVVYMLRPDEADLAVRAERIVKTLRYADATMTAEYDRYMPHQIMRSTLMDGHEMVVYDKTRDVFPLRDVLDHFGGKLPVRHVAWILSRVYNILSYFRYTDVVHNDISVDSLWISPKFHSILVLGGWWYAAKDNEKMVALPKRTIDVVPPDLIKGEKAKCQFDTYMARTLACELLGDRMGSRLLMDKDIPAPMLNWIRGPGTKDPVKEYMDWYNKCLIESFGERKFVEMKVTVDDLYPPKP